MGRGIWDVLSCSGTYASGTYYGTYTGTFTGSYVYLINIEDILVSGTCWEIHTGTAEVDDPVCQIQAYEGQWFIKSNDYNLMVADIELMPLCRNVQNYHGSSWTNWSWEFPHHHRAPATLNGDTTLIYQSSSTDRLYGTALLNKYMFTLNFDAGAIIRIDLTNGDTISQSAAGNSYSFSVIDNEWVVVDEYNEWSRLNLVTGEKVFIGSVPYSLSYYPKWGVIKDVLCVGQNLDYDYYPPAPSYTKRQQANYMFNIWTGQTLYGKVTPKLNADAFVEQTVSAVIANRDFFWAVQTTSENGGTWPEVVGPEPGIIWRLRTAPEVYGGGPGPFVGTFTYEATPVKMYYQPEIPYGDLYLQDMAYNPFNEMLYVIATFYPGETAHSYSLVLIMSPENLSYSIIYEANTSHSAYGGVLRFFQGLNELYVLVRTSLYEQTIYNVRNWSPVATIHSYYQFNSWYDGIANVLDVNNRLWYMGHGYIDDLTHLYSFNFDTGVIDNDISTGIEDAWGDRYYYPTDVQYRQVIPQNDGIIIFKHNTIQYAYQGRPSINNECTQIYRVT